MRYCKLKSAQVVNCGAGMDLATGDRYEGGKTEGFIKKRDIRLMFSVTNMMIGIDLKFTANKEKMQGNTDLLEQDSAHAGKMI